MDAPWVPPYFGSYEQLVQELLGNPFPRRRPAATTTRRGAFGRSGSGPVAGPAR